MRPRDYWGVGPKTEEKLLEEMTAERAVRAIEDADLRRLAEAGLPRGRAARVVRRARSDGGLELLATPDAREVYKALLGHVGRHAVNDDAADRISVLTPRADVDGAREHADDVLSARDALGHLGRTTVVDALAGYEADRLTAVETALQLLELDADDEFDVLAALDRVALEEARDVLVELDRPTEDDEIKRIQTSLDEVERLASDEDSVVERLQGGGAANETELREAYVELVVEEADVDYSDVEAAAAEDAHDLLDFVSTSLRGLGDTLRGRLDRLHREHTEELESRLTELEDEVDAAVDAVEETGLMVSLAEFARSIDGSPAEYSSDELELRGARNLSLVARDEDVQPVDYAVGADEPGGRVAVLTGANSGGKTTLLETVCETTLLAYLGLPVAADSATVPELDALVFHRRHSSFNAGVLESTLRNVVPPLTEKGRTLMLVDEFEAITEPGSAARLLHGLVKLTVDEDALGVFVTHLADDLEPLPDEARVDGIFAEGLDEDLELVVDYQPRFGELGRSTPEFIVSRLLARSDHPGERAGFEVLAEAVGLERVQQTLDEI
ncbi:MAG: DNA mismatch repair protein [Halobacteriota archaeon]